MNSLNEFRKRADEINKIKVQNSGKLANEIDIEVEYVLYPELVKDLINALEVSHKQIGILLEQDSVEVKANKNESYFYENFKNIDNCDLEDDDIEECYYDRYY
jgi:hypothetical protein